MADETLRDRMTKIETSIPLIHQQMGTMDERTTIISNKTDGLFRAFYGYDNKPGLLHDVSNLIEKMDDLKRLIWVILGIVMAIAVGGIYEAVLHAATIVK